MRKQMFLMGVLVLSGLVQVVGPQAVYAYNYGDYRSTTLVSKAWEAMRNDDLEAVLAFTNKCIELYADQAATMQESLFDYPEGTDDEIFAYWALNDVATAYYIQGEAYRKAGMEEESKQAYQTVIDKFSYGQCWDPQGWFWKPAEAAKEKLAMLESGINVDYGDYRSETLATKAWQALEEKNLDVVNTYVNKCLELYEEKAREMQDSLTEYPWESKEKIFSFWALNDIGTCLFIQGEANRMAGNKEEAKAAFQKLIDEFYYAQCWDPKGWFWKPAEAAQQKLDAMQS